MMNHVKQSTVITFCWQDCLERIQRKVHSGNPILDSEVVGDLAHKLLEKYGNTREQPTSVFPSYHLCGTSVA